MDDIIQVPLNLPDVRVLSTQRNAQGHWLIRVESTLEGTQCRRCGREIRELHGLDAVVRLRHLPLFDVPVFVEIRPKRYRCPYCAGKPTTTQRCAWYEPRSPNTKVYEQWALRMLINSTVADAARKLGVSEESIDGLLDRWIERSVDWEAWERLGVIGLDEIALKRGHRDVVVLVTVPLEEGGVEILAVLADRKKETVIAFLRTVPEPLRHTIERACTDMYEGFVRAIEEEVPWAEIVIDRFHVARAYRDGADTVRKQELKRLKRALPKAEYAQIKGAMWPFRKRPEDLEPQEWERLERLFTYAPKIEAAYHLREDLTDLFERHYTKAGAKCAIRAWCKRVRQSGLVEFESFLGTIERWMDEITNYFQGRQTSGFVEGFNNRVKVLMRRCYGIFNVGRLFQRLTLDLHGYQLFSHT
ncbi:MAG TPA: ISL3 family transposase [Gammaproteobacteria bacterium]|nr:ISL3 family transposase [Gammaproteobacteria bacterium]